MILSEPVEGAVYRSAKSIFFPSRSLQPGHLRSQLCTAGEEAARAKWHMLAAFSPIQVNFLAIDDIRCACHIVFIGPDEMRG